MKVYLDAIICLDLLDRSRQIHHIQLLGIGEIRIFQHGIFIFQVTLYYILLYLNAKEESKT